MFKNIDAALKGNINNTVSYSERARDLYQLDIDQHFVYANNYYEIEIEKNNGSNIFETIGVRIDKAVNANTGVKLSDDYKKIIFSQNPGLVLGKKFSFGENIWLTTDISSLYTNSCSCIVRRCNNVIRYQDDDGYDSEPCVIDYNSSGNQLDIKQDIILPTKVIKLYVQNNKITNQIKVNNRFIFGSQVFKVISLEDYNRIKTNDKHIGILTFILELDSLGANDDRINDIAANGLVITSNNFEENKTEYVTTSEQDTVLETVERFIMVPNKAEIREGQSVEYSFTFDGADVTERVAYTVLSDIPKSNYSIKKSNGKIIISCIHKNYETPLEIKFTFLEYEKNIKIRLRGLF